MNPLTKQADKPYQNEALNTVYEMLFCDRLDAYRSDKRSSEYPWDVILTQTPDPERLRAVATDSSLEARHRLLAYRGLAAIGSPSPQKELLGLVIEVAMPEGLDVLAAFQDGTARYVNYTERIVIWETRTDESDRLINQLFAHGSSVVDRIGRWDGDRRPFPTSGQVRLNFLVSDGLYFGEGPFNALYADPMGRSVLDSAIQLMDYLTQTDLSARR